MSRAEWKLWLPRGIEPTDEGRLSLLVHFHGHPPTVRSNVAHAGLQVAVVTANYNGFSSAYRKPFENAVLFRELLDNARAKVTEQPGFEAVRGWDRIAVSSFSAGFGAVRELLKTPEHFNAIDALLMADSVYASTAADGTPLDSQMAGYKAVRRVAPPRARSGSSSHTREVPTLHGYESTAETGDELLEHLGLTAEPTDETGRAPLRYYRHANRGGFQFWGARGDDAESHMQHLRRLSEWLDELGLPTASAKPNHSKSNKP